MSHCRAALSIVVGSVLGSGCSLMNRTVALPENRCGLYPAAFVTDLIATTLLALAVSESDAVDNNKTLWIVPGVFAASGVGGIVGAIMCKQAAAAYAKTPHEVALPTYVPPPLVPATDLPTQPEPMR